MSLQALIFIHTVNCRASSGASSPLQQQGGNLLAHDSGYLPKDPSCLRRSEFLLPLDAETLALYGKVLTALQKGPQS